MGKPEKFETAILSLSWIAFSWAVIIYLLHPIHDGDTWWQLAQGREMLERHVFARSDIFSSTLYHTQWINFEWLSQIAAYAVVKAFGLKGLVLTKAALGLIAMVLLLRLIAIGGTRGPWLFASTWLGYHVLQVRLCTRIELVSFILFPLLLMMVERVRAARMSSRAAVAAGVVMFALWANMHGGFAYGLMLLGCFLIGSRWAQDAPAAIATLDRLFVAGLVGSLINPWGARIFTVFIQHAMDFQNGTGVLAEWEAPTPASAPAFWACYILALIAIAWVLLKKRRTHYAWIPAVMVFAVLGTRYLRTTSYLAFVALPFATSLLKEIRVRRSVSIALIAVAVILLCFEKPFFRWPRTLSLVDPLTVPRGGVAFLDSNRIEGRLFNTYAFGGYVEWSSGRARPVFMDGRYIFYPLVEQYEDVMLGKNQPITVENWARYFDGFGVDHALVKYEPLRLHRAWDMPVKHESAMNVMFPKKTWALVYWDDACLVFLKRLPKFHPVIVADEYKTVLPYDLPAAINTVTLHSGSRADIEKELIRNEHEVGPTWRAYQIRTLLNQKN